MELAFNAKDIDSLFLQTPVADESKLTEKCTTLPT
jgi:hypothetical protein